MYQELMISHFLLIEKESNLAKEIEDKVFNSQQQTIARAEFQYCALTKIPRKCPNMELNSYPGSLDITQAYLHFQLSFSSHV